MTEAKIPRLEDYGFELPDSQIARYPAERRDQSRLLAIDRRSGELRHRHFSDLPDELRPGDLLIMNNTKVRPARVHGKRETGGKVEFLFLEELSPGLWKTRARPTTKLKDRERIKVEHAQMWVAGRESEHLLVQVTPEGGVNVEEWLERTGEIPIPPYFKRKAEALDRERYQTVYAERTGSVAAPTAGLHFTPELLSRVATRGVEVRYLNLTVGWGTFQPIRNEVLEKGELESEHYDIPPATLAAIETAKKEGRRVIAVGTTTTRALESAFRDYPPVPAGNTTLFIREPWNFRGIDGLITNFHLPQSSLLMLVAAFAGRENILSAYREAVRLGYRFYSYGDACFIA